MKEIARHAGIVANEFDASVFLYSGSVDDQGYGRLFTAFGENPETLRPHVLLILVTNGGSANSAYQIARLLQLHAGSSAGGELIVFIPAACKSAGTLIALGANRIIMQPTSELGPLDVQLLKQDEIGSRKSGLLARSTFESLANECFDLFETMMINIKHRSGDLISFKTASDIASSVATGVMAPVYGQINPEVVGSDYRDLQIAREYGIRLARIGGNVVSNAVDRLISGYPSHDFIIDQKEASEEIFKTIEPPTDSLYGLMNVLGGPVYREPPSPIVVRLDLEMGQDDEQPDDDASAGQGRHEAGIAPAPTGLDTLQPGDRRRRPGEGAGEPPAGQDVGADATGGDGRAAG